MTIYLTRNKGPIWERPWPSWKLVVPCETTQLVGTLGVVYGWFMAPTGWPLALMVWGYALVFFILGSAVKIGAYRTLGTPRSQPSASSPPRRKARRGGSLTGGGGKRVAFSNTAINGVEDETYPGGYGWI